MKAMIFAAGIGSRLKPYTLEHPKALVPVAGTPMLQRVILRLQAMGITEMVINVHHFAQQIIDFLRQNDNFGCTIHISDETACLLDTGGGLLAARQWLESAGEPILVYNVDILTDADLRPMLTAHQREHSIATLMVSERETSRYFLFGRDLRLRGWTNVSDHRVRPEGVDVEGLKKLAFSGIHLLQPEIFRSLAAYRAPGEVFSITDFYIDSCAHLPIYGYKPAGDYYWLDIGKPHTLAAAQEVLKGEHQREP